MNWSNVFSGPPLTFDAIRAAQKAIEAAFAARPSPVPLTFVTPPFIPHLAIDRRVCRAWIEGVEVKRAPVEDGRIYHVPAGRGVFSAQPEAFIAANPLRVVRQMRRHVARAGHRGRRGAVRVPLAEV